MRPGAKQRTRELSPRGTIFTKSSTRHALMGPARVTTPAVPLSRCVTSLSLPHLEGDGINIPYLARVVRDKGNRTYYLNFYLPTVCLPKHNVSSKRSEAWCTTFMAISPLSYNLVISPLTNTMPSADGHSKYLLDKWLNVYLTHNK